MAVGRISGPLLKSNLTRDGVDLAFENDLLYLDVNNLRVGINTSSPTHDLTVNGTTRTTVLETTTQADIGPITITGNNISSNNPVIFFNPASNNVVYQTQLTVDDITINSNIISTNNGNKDLELRPNGTGKVVTYSDTRVEGNVYVTGNITLDGNINVGNQDTDNVVINADVASNIIPNITDFYDIGTSSKRWNDVWVNNFQATTVTAGSIIVDGVDISTEQGNILYVAANGSNGNDGRHQNDPLATLEYALTKAVAGDTVLIYPGVYQEVTPLVIPKGVTVKGVALRSVIIEPDTSSQADDVFHIDGETSIEDITIRGHYYDSLNNTGYAFRFKPGMKVTTRSPYIRNVTVITQGSVTSTLDPRGYDQGDAGRGAYLDGSVADPSTNEASCLFHAVTFLCPGVDAIIMKDGARVEWLNCFTYWANKGLYGISGTSGIGGTGQTKLKVSGVVGIYNIGDTITYYDEDGVTVLASGTITNIISNEIYISGKATGFVEFDERVGKTVTGAGGAVISNTQAKFGATSLYLPLASTSNVTVPANIDFDFGTGDFTVEFWIYPLAQTVTQAVFDMRTSAAAQSSLMVDVNATGNVRLYVQGAYRITSAATLTDNVWNLVSISRVSGTTRMFINGAVEATTYADSNNYTTKPLVFGTYWDGASPLDAYVDDIRISKGIGRYNTTYVMPTAPFINDSYTVLLLHFTGANGSTTFSDDSVLVQDIRFSPSGATATYIDLADYTDFGCDIRCIGSATIYGNYGVYGDGAGVVMHLIGQNLSYIGAGKDTSNDPNLVIQANEVVELNGAKIYYTSVDARGDFRVGNFFYVNQQTGDVEFNNSIINISGPTGFTLTDGSNTTIIQPSKIETGNLRISGNTIESLTNEVNILSANDIINLDNNVNVTGDVNVTGNVTISGNIRLGDSTVDSIIFTGGIASDIIPSVGAAYNLGLPDYQWKELWVRTAEISDIEITTNYIRTTVSNSNLELRANGTGSILVEDIRINQRNISTDSGNISITPATTLDITASTTTVNGDMRVTGNYEVDGNTTLGNANTDTVTFRARVDSDIAPRLPNTYNLGSPALSWKTAYLSSLSVDDIFIDTNVIRTTVSNSDLELRANGIGSVLIERTRINENVISTDTGNLELRPATTLDITASTTTVNGDMRVTGNYTVDSNTTLGNSNTDRVTFNARVDSDIAPRLPNTYNLGSPALSWKTSYLSSAFVDDIAIDTNVIRTTVSNSNLELRANGIGSVLLEQIRVNENVISTDGLTNLEIRPATTLDIFANTNINGDLNVTGNVAIGGNITIGNNPNDIIDFEAEIGSDLIPALPVTYNIGNDSNRWKTLFVGNAFISDIEINTNYIRTTASNADLELRANGTGAIKLEDISVNQNVISVPTGTNLVLQPSGTGIVDINSTQALRLPRGITAQQPAAPQAGMIRYNTTNNNYEGYDGTYWRVLNGLYDVDQNTYLVAESSPGANDNTFYFYANGSQIADLNTTRLNTIRLDVDDIVVDGNTISTINNQNLNLTAAGTGTVRIENFSIKNNTITNTVSGSVTTVTQTGSGYFKISGTLGFVIPVGTGAQRPVGIPEIGFMRFNTDDSRVEIWDGTQWASAAGSSSGVTVADAEEIAILKALMLG